MTLTDGVQAADINALFGFRIECIERLGERNGLWAWTRLNSLFNWLPLAACIEDKVLCMHGGESPSAHGTGVKITLYGSGSASGSWMLCSDVIHIHVHLSDSLDSKTRRQ